MWHESVREQFHHLFIQRKRRSRSIVCNRLSLVLAWLPNAEKKRAHTHTFDAVSRQFLPFRMIWATYVQNISGHYSLYQLYQIFLTYKPYHKTFPNTLWNQREKNHIVIDWIAVEREPNINQFMCCFFLYDSIVWYGIAITRGNMTHRFKTVVVFTWTILHMKHTRYISNWAEQPKSFYLHGKYLYLIRFYFYWCARKHEICNTLTKCVVNKFNR